MVTGCVPIVEGGKILFVSASRKPEWILPKGGWESDEVMEESAIRECFEEAGVVGVLGARLSEIEYETRKSKKRRLDQEEAQKRAKTIREAHAVSPDTKVEATIGRSSVATSSVHDESSTSSVERATEVAEHVSNEEMSRIRGQAKPNDETCSVSSDTSAGYTHVRMTLFPLYVSEVKSEWPESGRFRKAVDIDEAIRITVNRPELQAALLEVKERNLHRP
jgi:diphosphoinositol-polyphosphate diphosphatase